MDFLFIAVPFIIVIIVITIVAKRIASHNFKCKHCNKEFCINWYKVIFTEHSSDEYRLVCPFCNTKDWCTEQPKHK